jgi:U3 small nucleolar RNA-associated protein 5
MSAAKRSRSGQSAAALHSASPLPKSKRQKVSPDGHTTPKANGLKFLVDEDLRTGKELTAETTNGLSTTRAPVVNQSRAKVTAELAGDDLDASQQQAHRTKSVTRANGTASDAEDASGSDEAEASAGKRAVKLQGPKASKGHATSHSNGKSAGARSRTNGEAEDGHGDISMDDAAEPAFGELLLAQNADAIDVTGSADHTRDRQLTNAFGEQNVEGLSSATLGTVLTQALKTNDQERLETCFAVADTERIRATIQRLNFQSATALLQRVSERIFSRPGRAGNLFTWIQWTLVVHGGYLATNEEIMKKIRALNRVVKERARGLAPLLHLKGKIDLLSTQLELRREVHQRTTAMNADDQDHEDGVIYIEGEDDWSDDDDVEGGAQRRRTVAKASRRAREQAGSDDDNDDDDDDDDDELRLLTNGEANGTGHGDDDDDDDEDGESDEDSEGLLDVEADETSDDEGDDGSEEDGSDGDDGAESVDEEEEEDEEGVKPPKLQTLNRRR